MAQILKNNVSGVLGLALSASGTSMTLLDASNFPAPTEGDFYLLTLIGLNANGQEASWEVVKVTGKASNTLTVVRAQEGTPAAAWPVATTVQLRLTAGSVVTPGVVADHIGSGGTAHTVATTSAAGFMSATDKTKLDGVATNANNYTHPTGDGNLHVPATGTTNAGKVLTAGATAGSLSWVEPLALGSTAGTELGTAAAGTATTAARSDHVHPVQTSVSGNAGTATKLETARTINGVSFDGSANIDISYPNLTSKPTLGTAAAKDIPATGNAAATQVVLGNDSRLSDARTPTAHTHAISDVTGLQTALNAKQPTLVSGTNIKTINSTSLLGSGNIDTGDVTLTGTQTLTNKTVEAGVFTNGYTEEVATASTGTAYTINLANGSVQILTLTGNVTYTFPTAVAGKSFLLVQKQDATGSRTATWPAAVKWPGNTAPTLTSTASKADVFAFTCDGTNWFGRVIGQAYL